MVDDPSDWVTENAGEGVDTVESSAASYQLFDNIENLTLVGAALSATGNDSNNIITGNDENNFLSGRGGDDVLIGGGGDDYMVESGDGNDRLVGGAGNDFMIGLDGNDVYEPGLRPGHRLRQQWRRRSAHGARRRPRPGRAHPRLVRAQPLILRVAGTGDSVSLYNWFHDPNYRIERFVFDDGTVWTIEDTESLRILGTAGDDPGLVGSVWSERIEGFTGSDSVASGAGDDVIVLQGDGSDWVFDSQGDDEMHWQGVDADQVERSRDWSNGDLILHLPNTTSMGEGLRIAGWFNSPENQIERFVFDDGTVWTAAEAQSLRILGTAGDDFLWGSQFDETIYARGGNDQLNGWLGDDVYDMGPGLGFDYLSDAGGNDEVRFGAGVVADELERSRDWSNGDLILHLPNTWAWARGCASRAGSTARRTRSSASCSTTARCGRRRRRSRFASWARPVTTSCGARSSTRRSTRAAATTS